MPVDSLPCVVQANEQGLGVAMAATRARRVAGRVHIMEVCRMALQLINITDQKAQTFRKRLSKVWGYPFNRTFDALTKQWSFDATTRVEGEEFTIVVNERGITLRPTSSSGRLVVGLDGVMAQPSYSPESAQGQLEADWLDRFRRGCWLSGIAIEATLTEKDEWTRDFSEEEFKSWGLDY
jgi:hypothetical protein